MRLGLLGGTFDPVHFGHLILAEQCREQCALDQVWFVPAGRPPHKPDARISDATARVEMLNFAVAGHRSFSVCRLELDRPGPTYTFETLEILRGEDPARELFFIMGGDSLSDLPSWRKPARIIELAEIVATGRGTEPPDVQSIAAALGEAAAKRVHSVTMPAIELSSTDIRRRVHEGKSIRFMTPRAVEAYIADRGLYTGAAGRPPA